MMRLCAEDVLLDADVSDYEGALRLVARHLFEEGKVKPTYEESLLAREREYPTGLRLGAINVAIPQTDFQHANTTQLAVMTFGHPVAWHSMEDPDETVGVSLVVLSVFDRPEHQVEALRQIMGVLQDQVLVTKAIKADTPQQVMDIFEGKG